MQEYPQIYHSDSFLFNSYNIKKDKRLLKSWISGSYVNTSSVINLQMYQYVNLDFNSFPQ